ncbi:MFS transporter [Alicyclobacillus sp. SO9]|nr:MFS transporter [Alicyclobacillus sp. SO9]
MVLVYAVYTLSHGSASAVSIVLLSEFLPMLFGPFIGVLADRLPRKPTFVLSICIQGVLLFGIGLTLHLHQLWLVYAGALLSAVATVASRTAGAGYILQFVPMDERKDATALQQVVISSMMLLGPPLGTAIYMAVQGQGALAVAGGLFLLAVILNIWVKAQKTPVSDAESHSFWYDLRTGLKYARNHWVMRFILSTGVLVGCSAGILNVLEIFLVTKFLHLPKTWLSVLLFVQGGGMLSVTPLLNRLTVPMKRLLPWSLIWCGIGMGLMISVRLWMVTLLGYLVFSVGNVAINLAVGTLMKTEVEESYQGRMSSLFTTAYGVTTGVFMVLTGRLQPILGVRFLIAAGSCIILISGALLLGFTIRYLKHSDSNLNLPQNSVGRDVDPLP